LPLLQEQHTGVCLSVNPSAGGAYGYVDMGGWVGGQAEYVMVPYADFNLLKFPDRDQAMAKIRDLTCLSDILPTGYHGAVSAGVGPGSTVYVAGAGRWAGRCGIGPLAGRGGGDCGGCEPGAAGACAGGGF
jgi:glutathione-independent formaldehyde dehydrogenase